MDFFAQIAKSGIQGRRDALTDHPPSPVPDRITPLISCTRPPTEQPTDIETHEQLKAALAESRRRFEPFLRELAPGLQGLRTVIPLDKFFWRLRGDDQEAPVALPHYGGPLGCAETVYRTAVNIEKLPPNRHAYIVVNGADYIAKIYINGRFAGRHEGFFASFEFDITDFIREGENSVVIELQNDYIMHGSRAEGDTENIYGDKIYAATGPGYDEPETGWHHCPPAMGLFESVAIELRAPVHISTTFARTLDSEMEFWIEAGSSLYQPRHISLRLSLYGKNHSQTVFEGVEYSPSTGKELGLGDTYQEVIARRDGTYKAALPMPCHKGRNLYKIRIPADDLLWWNIDSPYLYELHIELLDRDGSLLDTYSYTFGRRSFAQDTTSETKGMFYLNGAPIRLRGANTMGFEQQNIMRGDTDQMIDDILLARLCNMNFLRLTQRPVQQGVYDLCDKLGLLIQTDLPMFGCLRRQQLCEALRQTEEMVRHVRGHACCILITYINEPFPNAFNLPSMNLEREELEKFFEMADTIVRLHNPDCVIKHVDGDYDPPSATLPDNHCYPMWYNGHGIDIGKLHKGYWIPTAPGWYCGCGEFGCEGLENFDLMLRTYPEKWLPQEGEAFKSWTPSCISSAQTGDFYHFFYDRPDTPEQWVLESQRFQAFATRFMTEAMRRNNRMVTFAIHLFIDAFPSSWMKTIMDCERTPKPSFFAYRKALKPVLLSLRSDRHTFGGGETAVVEGWLCNDTQKCGGYTLRYELISGGNVTAAADVPVEMSANRAECVSRVSFDLPESECRTVLTLRGLLLDNGECVASSELDLAVLPECGVVDNLTVRSVSEITARDIEAVKNGAVLWVDKPLPGRYKVGPYEFEARESGMAPMHFASSKTGHAWAGGLHQDDMRHWYSAELDRIAPLADCTLEAPTDFKTVLKSRNISKSDGSWQDAPLLCEAQLGMGKIILSQISYAQMTQNPAGRIILSRIKNQQEAHHESR